MTIDTSTPAPDRAAPAAEDAVAARALDRAGRRLERRELHRSRSLSASTALWLTAIAVAALAALLLLERAGAGIPGVTLPGAEAIASLAGDAGAVGIAIGAGAGVVGLVLLVLGISRGRRTRHALVRQGVVVVVDDAVLASAVSRSAARAARATGDRARTTVGPRSATVSLRSQSGYPLDGAAAADAARALLSGLQPRTAMRVAVREERDA